MTINPSQFSRLPNALTAHLHAAFYVTEEGGFSRADAFAQALAVSQQLPERPYVVNLCQSRYLFVIAYLAAMLRNQITLLPPNQTPRTLADLMAAYAPAYCISDSLTPPLAHTFKLSYADLRAATDSFPPLQEQRTLSISFTSGSTGKPKAIPKNWQEFQSAAQLALQQLGLANKPLTLVSTVPPQHMYGLETSLFWPLYSALHLHDSRPFFPADLCASLHAVSAPRILVSTPTHLQACTKSSIIWPTIERVLSSTAPMTLPLALAIETQFQAPLHELLGSTETLSFASRQPLQTEDWQPYAGIQLSVGDGQFTVHGGHLGQPTVLDDSVLLKPDGRFSLQGRSADLIKIAGKRASLSELNSILNSIPGIEEGLFFRDNHERLSVLIVGDLTKETLLQVLRQAIDPVFLPRKILRAPSLPRNATGKILKAETEALIQELEFA